MVSFADMVTILMAFFVVMYSMSGPKDVEKEEAVLNSLRKSLGRWPAVPAGTWVPRDSKLAAYASLGRGDGPGTAPQPEPAPGHGGLPRVEREPPRTQTVLGGTVYFDDGAEGLSDEGRRQLTLVAEALAGKPQRIEIRGHATPRPLPEGSPHGDRWMLAYRRCRQSMDFLVELGTDPRRIRLGVAAQEAADDPRLAFKECRVEVFLLDEFVDAGAAAAAP
jgi:chemotaxis protein MotB